MIVLGTAGHIDHGKTTLVRALTGIDTDRLPVEKERGITTELGFAHMDLGDGRIASIVDAPGHERFVRHMIAGAGGLDLAVLVVAADEGVMPQTREHLDILGLVGVRAGLVVLTRCDLVPPEDVALARDDVTTALAGTFLEHASILEFAAPRIDELPAFRDRFVATVRALLPALPDRPVDRPFRMAVDRVFVAPGFGAVLTGTVTTGEVGVGDEVELLPSGRRARLRSLQQHGIPVERAAPGMRAALNLQGLDAHQVARGEVVTTTGAMRLGSVLDVSVTLLPRIRKPFSRRTACTIHLGTRMLAGHLVLLDRQSLPPGDTALAQVRLSEPVAALAGERFVIRGFEVLPGYGRTLAGGTILRPDAPSRRSTDEVAIAWLRDTRDGDAAAKARAAIELSGAAGASSDDLLAVGPLGRRDLNRALSHLTGAGLAIPFQAAGRTRYLGAAVRERLAEAVRVALAEAHRRQPDRPAVTVEEIQGALPSRPSLEVIGTALRHLASAGGVVPAGTAWRLPTHATRGALLGDATLVRLQSVVREAGVSAPAIDEIATRAGLVPAAARDALHELARRGALVRLAGDLFFDAGVLADVERRLVAFLDENTTITTSRFKELLATTRRTAIPLAEWFDSRHVTIRVSESERKRFGK